LCSVKLLLLSIAGNAFTFSSKLRVLDVFVPKAVADRFKGPKYGIRGIREKYCQETRRSAPKGSYRGAEAGSLEDICRLVENPHLIWL
jgi:hypothetical protein